VGLPLFAKRLAERLSAFDPGNKYVALDTYYNKWDKVKARFLIPRSDAVFSINGSMTKSRVFDLALKKEIPLIMNWVGTDVLKAIEAERSNRANPEYKAKAIHFCEVDWIKEELSVIGIVPEIVNFASFDKEFELKLPEGEFTVLTYISDGRAEFYGIKSVLNLANEFPEIQFLIAGTKAESYAPLPANVKALGWVTNMDELYDRSHVCLRFPEHDGLSTFILESLARGKEVLYKYPFNFCRHCDDDERLELEVRRLYSEFKSGELKINEEGAHFVQREFNSEHILNGLITRFKFLCGKG
jgi:glycosyltransferase involved in cell wall biosynthesis